MSTWKTLEPFVLGGASGMIATSVIQPIDMIKVRIQLAGEGGKKAAAAGADAAAAAAARPSTNPVVITRQIIAQDGFFSLYRGLSAALLRQATYTTARLGIFRSISDYMEGSGPVKKKLSFAEKAFAGLAAGGLGAVVGTPADVALIRMQADSTLPLDQRRNYKGVGDALLRMTREEGIGGLFKGCLPVVTRAMALNVGMLATHDQALEELNKITNKSVANVGAKVISGFFASAFSLPFDFVKTRIQKQKPAADGTLKYKSSMHCVSRVIAEEGPMAFYKGFWTYYVRIAPHAMITLFALDALKALTK